MSSPQQQESLLASRDAIVDIPVQRWSASKFYDPDLGPGHSRVTRGGFLEQDVALWDAQFFGISPREADLIDPRHRVLMSLARVDPSEVGYFEAHDTGRLPDGTSRRGPPGCQRSGDRRQVVLLA